MHRKHWLIIGLFIITVVACNKDIVEQILSFEKPVNFPEPVYHFNTNEITRAKFELGRKLFYEPRLSRDNTVSCGSCHIQSSAFTHHGHDVSHGIDDRLGSRNSPSIVNMAWSNTFFWDGGVFDLDLQPIVPITNPVEMDETLQNVMNKLKAHNQYPGLFNKAFGSTEINTERMMKALSQFMVMLVSANSKYDKVMRKEGENFTDDEQKGYEIFQTKCATCHKEPLFTDHSFRNNGIGIGLNKDVGRYAVTLNEADKYTFKVPSLRNLSYTSPYMHDGRFITLKAVLEKYNGGELGITLSEEEQTQLIAFLKTLDDVEFITDKRFSEQ
jgi:cytochrome c peroxidase